MEAKPDMEWAIERLIVGGIWYVWPRLFLIASPYNVYTNYEGAYPPNFSPKRFPLIVLRKFSTISSECMIMSYQLMTWIKWILNSSFIPFHSFFCVWIKFFLWNKILSTSKMLLINYSNILGINCKIAQQLLQWLIIESQHISG